MWVEIANFPISNVSVCSNDSLCSRVANCSNQLSTIWTEYFKIAAVKVNVLILSVIRSVDSCILSLFKNCNNFNSYSTTLNEIWQHVWFYLISSSEINQFSMKQLNLLNSPSKAITLKKVAKLDNGIRKVDAKEKASKLQVIFKNGGRTSGINLSFLFKMWK